MKIVALDQSDSLRGVRPICAEATLILGCALSHACPSYACQKLAALLHYVWEPGPTGQTGLASTADSALSADLGSTEMSSPIATPAAPQTAPSVFSTLTRSLEDAKGVHTETGIISDRLNGKVLSAVKHDEY